MTTDKQPRRAKRTHAEQEADLKAKLAALEDKKSIALRKEADAVHRLIYTMVRERGELLPNEVRAACETADAEICKWLAAGKPGAG